MRELCSLAPQRKGVEGKFHAANMELRELLAAFKPLITFTRGKEVGL
jgi:hypothetical protein